MENHPADDHGNSGHYRFCDRAFCHERHTARRCRYGNQYGGGLRGPFPGEHHIRNLCLCTASTNITEIIQELNEDTQRANETIEHSVASVEKQTSLIENTREKFGKVGDEVAELTRNIDAAEASIQKILESIYALAQNLDASV